MNHLLKILKYIFVFVVGIAIAVLSLFVCVAIGAYVGTLVGASILAGGFCGFLAWPVVAWLTAEALKKKK